MSKMVKWSKKIENFIVEEMTKGKMPAIIFREHADKLPSIRTFNRKQIDDPVFKEKIDAAYTVIYQQLQAELTELTSKTTSELKPDVDFKEAAEWKKTRVDALKFELGKLAGVFSRRYDKKQTIEHQGAVENSFKFVIPDYSSNRIIDINDKT